MGDEKRCNACSRRSVRLDNLYLSRRGVTTVYNLSVDRAFDPSEGVRLLWLLCASLRVGQHRQTKGGD